MLNFIPMPVFQYQCGSCSAVFEQLVTLTCHSVNCLNCDSIAVERSEATYFYPNKNFCPHDKELDKEKLKTQLAGIMSDQALRCGGCGTDGAAGNCGSGKKGGCGSGGCGGCGSGGGCGNNKKLSLNISSPLV